MGKEDYRMLSLDNTVVNRFLREVKLYSWLRKGASSSTGHCCAEIMLFVWNTGSKNELNIENV